MAMLPDSRGSLHGRVIVWVVFFVLSGIASPMMVMQVTYSYSPPSKTLWMLYPLYLGNILAGCFAPRVERSHWFDGSRLFGFDFCGQALCNLGLVAVGPPLYAIFYKSVTVFTGLISVCCLPPASRPTRLQWLAMLIITAGLCMQGVESLMTLGRQQLVGALLVVLGCVFYASGAVASEFYLGVRRESLSPLQAAWVIGVEGSAICIVWALFTVREFYYPFGFWMLFAALVLSNACHQATWFLLVGRIGACATAVLKAFQSVCLFLSAGALFCSRDKLECLTFEKLTSFVVVSIGVLLYAYPSQRVDGSAQQNQERAPLIGPGAKPVVR